VRRRGSLLAHVQNTHHQYNLPEPRAKIAYKANREGVAEIFAEADARKSMEICDRDSEARDGLLEDARHPQALIGDPPPLRHSRGAEGRSSKELCPLLEPGANWTNQSQQEIWALPGFVWVLSYMRMR
jgi:hypothetical protein